MKGLRIERNIFNNKNIENRVNFSGFSMNKDNAIKIVIVLTIISIFAFVAAMQPAYAQVSSFSGAINLSSNDGVSNFPQAAVSGNNVYVVWIDSNDIFFSRSTDNGATFGSSTNLSNTPATSLSPQIIASGNNVYVVWVDSNDIFIRASTDNGATFGSVINLSNTPSGFSSSPQVAASGNNAYVVWVDSSPGNDDIFIRASTDNGATFGSTTNLSSNVGVSNSPQIAASGNNAYVTWSDDTLGSTDIFFRASSDNGTNFGSLINLGNNAGVSFEPQIATSGNNAYVTWSDDTTGNMDIFFSRSTDNGATFGSSTNLSSNTGTSDQPQIAVSGNTVYLTWRDNTPGNNDIFFIRSTDNGATFGSAVNLSSNSGASISPQIAASGNNVYVTWSDGTGLTAPNTDIFFSRSTDNGATFGSSTNLSSNTGTSSSPQIAASGNNVYVVWVDGIAGNTDIFFKRSTDNGSTFGSTVNLSINSSPTSSSPQVAVSGNNVYVVWVDSNDIFFKRSTDNGATFGSAVNLSSNSGASISPQIAASGNNVYVTWVDNTPGNNDIFFRRSTDNGANFDASINLSSNSGASISPQIAASGNSVYVTWSDSTPGNNDIFIKASTDNGATFGSAVNLSSNSGASISPQIAASGNNVFATWQDNTNVGFGTTGEIFFVRSTDTGATFGSIVNLSSNSGASSIPQVAVSGNNVYVTWRDLTNVGFGTTGEIFFVRSTDTGATFGSIVNLSSNSGTSAQVDIAASGSNVYVVWQDNTPGNTEIFFRASTDNGANFIPAIANPATNLSSTSTASSVPQVAASGSNVYVTWTDNSPVDILFRSSSDNGANFGSSINLSNNAGNSAGPQIAVSGNNVYVIWIDPNDPQGNVLGNNDIFFRRSTETAMVSVAMTPSGSVLIANSNIGNIGTGQPVEITLTQNTLQGIQLNGIKFIPASGGTINLQITASNAVPEINIPPPVLSLTVVQSGTIDLSQSSSFTNFPVATVQVDKAEGVCPIFSLFFLDTSLVPNHWVPLNSAKVVSETGTSCTEEVELPHFSSFAMAPSKFGSKFSVGGAVRPTGGGDPSHLIVDTLPPSISLFYHKPDVVHQGDTVTITAQISDDVGVSKAMVFYNTEEGERNLQNVDMTKISGSMDSFRADIDAITTSDIRYWIYTEDFAGNNVQSSVLTLDVQQGSSVSVTKKTELSAYVSTIKPKSIQPAEKLEVLSVNNGNVIKSYPDKIVIKNAGNVTVGNIRIMLSPEISKSFRLSNMAIKSIEPNGNVTVMLELNGNPNRNMFGGLVGYNGELMVMAEHHSPIILPLNIGTQESHYLSDYLDKVASMTKQRFNKLPLLNALLPHPDEYKDFGLTTSSGREITSASDSLIIKNTSDKQINNVRIIVSKLGNAFLVDKSNIKTLAPNESITIKLIPKMDSTKYSPKDFIGEIIVVGDNGLPNVIPVRINGTERKDSMYEYEVRTMSNNTITEAVDRITIKNIANRTMDSVKLILPKDLDRILHLSENTFQTIAPGEEVAVDLRFKATMGEKKELFMQNYKGELIIVSEHHNARKIPIQIEWKKVESKHFTVYARSGDEPIAKGVIDVLESNYQNMTSRFGEMKTKTVIYMAGSIKEMKIVNPSGHPYYSYTDDTLFIYASDDVQHNAFKEFVYRLIINNYPTYHNIKKFIFDQENWLMDGVSSYVAANITDHGMVKNGAFVGYTSFQWYGEGSLEEYSATHMFFRYLENKYGSKVIDKTLYYLGTGMVSNHRCDTIENCAVIQAVYAVNGLDMDKAKYKLDFKSLVEEWKEDVVRNYYSNENE